MTRTTLRFRRVTRHSWGPEPSRVVLVAFIEDGETNRAEVWGAADGKPVLLESAEGVSLRRARGPVVIDHADGSAWTLAGVGCSCNVPAPLRGFNPLHAR